jgi:hypothetical protein
MAIILKTHPEFNDAWKEYLKYWGGEEAGLSNDMLEYSCYFNESFKKIPENKLIGIFKMIELVMTDGDESVKDAVATCFLENLINLSSFEYIEESPCFEYLGAESKKYYKAINEFYNRV